MNWLSRFDEWMTWSTLDCPGSPYQTWPRGLFWLAFGTLTALALMFVVLPAKLFLPRSKLPEGWR